MLFVEIDKCTNFVRIMSKGRVIYVLFVSILLIFDAYSDARRFGGSSRSHSGGRSGSRGFFSRISPFSRKTKPTSPQIPRSNQGINPYERQPAYNPYFTPSKSAHSGIKQSSAGVSSKNVQKNLYNSPGNIPNPPYPVHSQKSPYFPPKVHNVPQQPSAPSASGLNKVASHGRTPLYGASGGVSNPHHSAQMGPKQINPYGPQPAYNPYLSQPTGWGQSNFYQTGYANPGSSFGPQAWNQPSRSSGLLGGIFGSVLGSKLGKYGMGGPGHTFGGYGGYGLGGYPAGIGRGTGSFFGGGHTIRNALLAAGGTYLAMKAFRKIGSGWGGYYDQYDPRRYSGDYQVVNIYVVNGTQVYTNQSEVVNAKDLQLNVKQLNGSNFLDNNTLIFNLNGTDAVLQLNDTEDISSLLGNYVPIDNFTLMGSESSARGSNSAGSFITPIPEALIFESKYNTSKAIDKESFVYAYCAVVRRLCSLSLDGGMTCCMRINKDCCDPLQTGKYLL